jgi:hypothetical protein
VGICNHICNHTCNHICNHICNHTCNHYRRWAWSDEPLGHGTVDLAALGRGGLAHGIECSAPLSTQGVVQLTARWVPDSTGLEPGSGGSSRGSSPRRQASPPLSPKRRPDSAPAQPLETETFVVSLDGLCVAMVPPTDPTAGWIHAPHGTPGAAPPDGYLLEPTLAALRIKVQLGSKVHAEQALYLPRTFPVPSLYLPCRCTQSRP